MASDTRMNVDPIVRDQTLQVDRYMMHPFPHPSTVTGSHSERTEGRIY